MNELCVAFVIILTDLVEGFSEVLQVLSRDLSHISSHAELQFCSFGPVNLVKDYQAKTMLYWI